MKRLPNRTTLHKYELISSANPKEPLQVAVLTQERADKLNLFLPIWYRWRPQQKV